MSTRFHMARGALLALAATLAGCASTTPQWDSRFGDTVRAAMAAQVAEPAAARNPNPVTGIDARAASAAQSRYERSFQDTVVPVSIIGSTK